MEEFNSRVAAQRQILELVNGTYSRQGEALFGLSTKAIDRWAQANRVDPDATIVTLLKTAAAQLFFLANKSQEHISPEYRVRSAQVSRTEKAIADALSTLTG